MINRIFDARWHYISDYKCKGNTYKDTYLNMKELGELDSNKPFIKKWTIKSSF